MKRFSLLTVVAMGIALAIGTIGCKSSGKKTDTPYVTKFGSGATGTPGQGNTPYVPPTEAAQPPINITPSTTESANLLSTNLNELPDNDTLKNMVPDRDIFKADTVFFAYDRSTINKTEESKIESVVKVLKEQTATKIQVEGHCDERGTEEYNRSLGERRALAVREYLVRSGIDGKRVFTISFGEDKPADTGHTEAAWAKNRRGEFILYRPKAQ